jgi:ubiquinone/menaquinone biosynthesis C-methylase UbiE
MERTARKTGEQINRDRFRKRLLKYTRKAFKLLPEMDKPHILDVGCGSGVPTIELARLSKGTVVGIDIDQSLLNKLNRKIEREGLSNRVEARKGSMFELDFPDESFEIIWAEGAVQAIGFEEGLEEWRRFLKPNGFLVVHDEIRTVSSSLEKTSTLGYKLIDHFSLPKDAWWVEYYRPLENLVKELYEEYKDNCEALRTLEKVQNEIDMVKGSSEECISAFYIMQKK